MSSKKPGSMDRDRRGPVRVAVLGIVTTMFLAAALAIGWRFESDMAIAGTRAAQGSTLLATRCGPIEYQEAGTGVPLLVVHGSGGGHDQGMAFAGAMAQQGIRVIAMSRFGYLRTPMPTDASPAAQADAHVCLLDALGVRQAAVLGGSAGAPSATQMAIRHPGRTTALVLVVPLAYKPGTLADSAPPASPLAQKMLAWLVGSDFLFWSGLHVARGQVTRNVLATSPDQLAAASPQEQARVDAIIDHILPLSARAQGMRGDMAVATNLVPYPLESIRAPTLIISARDDGFGTYANAQYTASRIAGSKFIGFEEGGHVLVGHDAEMQAAIVKLLKALAKP